MDHKPLVPFPPWVEMMLPPFAVVANLFFAWLFIYRLDWINRSWQAFGVRLNPTATRLMACLFLVGAASNTVELVRMVASHIP